MPGSERAHPILQGVPHDVEPRFSPSGELVAFRSDAELGLDNIWAMKWAGCSAMSLQSSSPGLALAFSVRDEDDKLLSSGVRETTERKDRRLLREGRLDGERLVASPTNLAHAKKKTAYRVTNETFRFVVNPRWHPSSQSIVGTKYYTASRSVGGGEIWLYEVPPADGERHAVGIGAGKRVASRTLPPGWSAQEYNEQQIGPEQVCAKTVHEHTTQSPPGYLDL